MHENAGGREEHEHNHIAHGCDAMTEMDHVFVRLQRRVPSIFVRPAELEGMGQDNGSERAGSDAKRISPGWDGCVIPWARLLELSSFPLLYHFYGGYCDDRYDEGETCNISGLRMGAI